MSKGQDGQPWTRYFYRLMESRTRTLDPVQYTVYRRLYDRMLAQGGQVDGTLTDLARLCGVSRIKFVQALDHLMRLGLLSGTRIGTCRKRAAAIIIDEEIRDELARARRYFDQRMDAGAASAEARGARPKRNRRRDKGTPMEEFWQGETAGLCEKRPNGRCRDSESELPPLTPPRAAGSGPQPEGAGPARPQSRPTHIEAVSQYVRHLRRDTPDMDGFKGDASAAHSVRGMWLTGHWDGHRDTRPDEVSARRSTIEGENLEIRSLDEIAEKRGLEGENIAQFPDPQQRRTGTDD